MRDGDIRRYMELVGGERVTDGYVEGCDDREALRDLVVLFN